MTYRALLVGNSVFDADAGLQPLNAPVKDVARLHRALVDTEVGLFEDPHVRLVTERSGNDILDELDRFFGEGQRDDLLLFYYSGHGVLDERNQLYLCGRDTLSDRLLRTGISNTRINEFIAQSVCQRTVILLDCCSSGMFKSGPIGGQLAGPGRFIVSSTRGIALANDAATATGTSLFTNSLVDGLLGGAPDPNDDGFIDLREIYDYVRDRLVASSKQIPHCRFDGDASVPIARVHPRRNAERRSPTPRPGEPHEPTFVLAESVISLLAVGADEPVPPEVVEVVRLTDEPLELEAHTNDTWLHVTASPDQLTIAFDPTPGRNHGKIVVRDQASGTSQTLRIEVFVRQPHATIIPDTASTIVESPPSPVVPAPLGDSGQRPKLDTRSTQDAAAAAQPSPSIHNHQASHTTYKSVPRTLRAAQDAQTDTDQAQRQTPEIPPSPPTTARRRWIWLLIAPLVLGLATVILVLAVPTNGSHRTNTGPPSRAPSAPLSLSRTPNPSHSNVGKPYGILHAPAWLYTDPTNPNSAQGQKSGTANLICAQYGFAPNGTNGDDYWYYLGPGQWINDDNIDGHGNKTALVNACEGNPPHAGSITLPGRSNSGAPSSTQPATVPTQSTDGSVTQPASPCPSSELTGNITVVSPASFILTITNNATSACVLRGPLTMVKDDTKKPLGTVPFSDVTLHPGQSAPGATFGWSQGVCPDGQVIDFSPNGQSGSFSATIPSNTGCNAAAPAP